MNQTQLNYFFSLLERFGWLGNWLFFFIAFVECVPFAGSVFPGGAIIVIAGFLAAQGYFNVIDVIIFAALGALIGDSLSYMLGRWSGNWIRKKKFISAEQITKGEQFSRKYGAPGIYWSRVFGTPTAIVPFISGTTRIKPQKFFFWNFFGGITWSVSHVIVGYFSGNILSVIIHKWSGRLSLIAIICLSVILLYWLIRKHHENIGRLYSKASKNFTEKLLSLPWFKKFIARFPVLDEFFNTKIHQEKILGGFIGGTILIIFYILVLILDLV